MQVLIAKMALNRTFIYLAVAARIVQSVFLVGVHTSYDNSDLGFSNQ